MQAHSAALLRLALGLALRTEASVEGGGARAEQLAQLLADVAPARDASAAADALAGALLR